MSEPWHLKKSSFVVKVVYGASNEVPQQVSLCSLFWRFWGMLLFGWPIIGILAVLITVIGGMLVYGSGLLFGYWPNFREESLYLQIKHWPTWRGHRIWPATILLAVGGVVAVQQYWRPVFLWLMNSWAFVGGILIGCIIVGVMLYFREIGQCITDSSVVRLCVERTKAAKRKVCPLITIR